MALWRGSPVTLSQTTVVSLWLVIPMPGFKRNICTCIFSCNVLARIKVCHSLDGWMICDFMSIPTVFQSYQDDGWIIMKGCVQWNPVYG